MKRAVFLIVFALCLSACASVGPFPLNHFYGDQCPYGFHPGIDFDISRGTPIIAVSNGRVSWMNKTIADGDEMIINHGKHFRSLYAHLSKVFVKKDEFVKRGQLIALSGASNNYGRTDYQHLHFGICRNGAQGCRYQSETLDPNLFWLGRSRNASDPKRDYSVYPQKEITLPVACGDYARVLREESREKEQ